MDQNLYALTEKRVNRTLENLQKNNMSAIYVPKKEDVVGEVAKLISEGDTVAVGGSVTLSEAGVLELLRNGKYNFLDRYAPGLSKEETNEILRQGLLADVFLCSSNAITERGELYNVDGNSNRIAALVFGPKSVIVVAGINKIVYDLDEAVLRVKQIAAPANCLRLGYETYCMHDGQCQSLHSNSSRDITEGCSSATRICCNYVISARQRIKDRIKVIIVGEPMGY
ncbi:MAG: lactate utilization protein [Bacillota bacterium]|nr:lactate utilization protein [Bacillota bacterium]